MSGFSGKFPFLFHSDEMSQHFGQKIQVKNVTALGMNYYSWSKLNFFPIRPNFLVEIFSYWADRNPFTSSQNVAGTKSHCRWTLV
jgi:hypothetical protein